MSTINVRDGVMQIVNRYTASMKADIMNYLDKSVEENRQLRKENTELKAKVKELETLRGLDRPKMEEAVKPKKTLTYGVVDQDLFVEGRMDEPEKYLYFQETSDRLYAHIGLDKTEGAMAPGHKPVLLIAKDCSGSMKAWDHYMSRCIATWTINMLNRKYGQHVEVRYVNFHTEAKEVSEDEFHKHSSPNGTIASTAGKLLNEIADEYNYETTDDIHVLFLSDGDNITSDNPQLIKYFKRLVSKSKDVWYIEPNQHNRFSTIRAGFETKRNVEKIGMFAMSFNSREHVLFVLKHMFNRKLDREVGK
ncbi:sporulation protein [Bacillus phage CM1]|nr:sporulation protein [Bacillus phage CM1]